MSIKIPVPVQNGTCDRTISFDSTSPTASEVMLLNHDYADPIDMRDSIKFEMEKIDRQKRQNLIYEPMTEAKTKQTDFNSNNEKACKCGIQNWCILFVFLVSSCSLALSLLIIFGIVETKESGTQDYNPLTGKLSSRDKTQRELGRILRTPDGDEKRIIVDELKKNISLLTDQIPSFVRQLATLEAQLNKLSVTEGPRVVSTPRVKKSKKNVVGRLSKCRYKTEVSNHPFEDEPEKTLAKTTWLSGEKGFELVGASCTTFGGAQYGLYQKEMSSGEQLFQCRCAGKSQTETFIAGELECRMHYWECPITINAE